jgi:D-lyxose ketol-isomerase
MARFHFHTKDGIACSDPQGTELPNFEAAQAHAVQHLSERLRGNPHLVWDTRDFSIIVTDDHGLTLFTLDLTANVSAAADKTRRNAAE